MTLSQISACAAGVGAAFQRGGSGPSAQHPSQQNPAETPPGHALPPAHRLRGSEAQTGLSGKPRLLCPHRYGQGQGNCRTNTLTNPSVSTRDQFHLAQG